MNIIQMGLAPLAHMRIHNEEGKPFLPDLGKAVKEGVHALKIAWSACKIDVTLGFKWLLGVKLLNFSVSGPDFEPRSHFFQAKKWLEICGRFHPFYTKERKHFFDKLQLLGVKLINISVSGSIFELKYHLQAKKYLGISGHIFLIITRNQKMFIQICTFFLCWTYVVANFLDLVFEKKPFIYIT